MTNKKVKPIILHADDEECVRFIISRLIMRGFPDCEFEQFSNGTDLEGRLKNGVDSPCVVVTDNHMPGISGSELIKEYANNTQFKGKVPFILLYGGGSEIGERALENGAYAFVTKPFHIETIVSTIRGAIDYSRTFLDSGNQQQQV